MKRRNFLQAGIGLGMLSPTNWKTGIAMAKEASVPTNPDQPKITGAPAFIDTEVMPGVESLQVELLPPTAPRSVRVSLRVRADAADAAGFEHCGEACLDHVGADAEFWLQEATFTLVDRPCSDPRTVQVPDVGVALAQIAERVDTWPQTAAVCDDVLRAFDPSAPAFAGVKNLRAARFFPKVSRGGHDIGRVGDSLSPARARALPRGYLGVGDNALCG